MSTAAVTYQSLDCLSCANCLPADIILEVPFALVTDPPGDYGFIYGSLTAVTFDGTFYNYTFEFDDTQVSSGNQILPSNILGVLCEGTLTHWIADQRFPAMFAYPRGKPT